MTPGEYQANLAGVNLFFGAVLGVVLAGTDRLGTRDFSITLVSTAGLVVMLLHVTSSRFRLLNAVVAAVLIALLPRFLAVVLQEPAAVPRHLQPTLLIWWAFIGLAEFGPRERSTTDAATGRIQRPPE